jgi:hypothetical protein
VRPVEGLRLSSARIGSCRSSNALSGAAGAQNDGVSCFAAVAVASRGPRDRNCAARGRSLRLPEFLEFPRIYTRAIALKASDRLCCDASVEVREQTGPCAAR